MEFNELKDIQGPVAYPENYFWYILISIAVLLIGSGIAWYFFKKKKDGILLEEKKSPWEIAIEQLNRLIAQKYLEDHKFHLFYAELSNIVRAYIEDRFLIRAVEMTTEEFFQSVRKSDALTGAQKEALRPFLEAADMVKFAKYTPSIQEAKEGYELAKVFIEETKIVEEEISDV